MESAAALLFFVAEFLSLGSDGSGALPKKQDNVSVAVFRGAEREREIGIPSCFAQYPSTAPRHGPLLRLRER